MSRLLLLAYRDSSLVYSFEPNPDLKPTGTVFTLALSNRDGVSPFFIPRQDDGWASLHPQEPNPSPDQYRIVDVPVARFETLVEQHKFPWDSMQRPVLLKIDTEGNELRVLDGFGRYLTGVDYIMLEAGNTKRGSVEEDLFAIT